MSLPQEKTKSPYDCARNSMYSSEEEILEDMEKESEKRVQWLTSVPSDGTSTADMNSLDASCDDNAGDGLIPGAPVDTEDSNSPQSPELFVHYATVQGYTSNYNTWPDTFELPERPRCSCGRRTRPIAASSSERTSMNNGGHTSQTAPLNLTASREGISNGVAPISNSTSSSERPSPTDSTSDTSVSLSFASHSTPNSPHASIGASNNGLGLNGSTINGSSHTTQHAHVNGISPDTATSPLNGSAQRSQGPTPSSNRYALYQSSPDINRTRPRRTLTNQLYEKALARANHFHENTAVTNGSTRDASRSRSEGFSGTLANPPYTTSPSYPAFDRPLSANTRDQSPRNGPSPPYSRSLAPHNELQSSSNGNPYPYNGSTTTPRQQQPPLAASLQNGRVIAPATPGHSQSRYRNSQLPGRVTRTSQPNGLSPTQLQASSYPGPHPPPPPGLPKQVSPRELSTWRRTDETPPQSPPTREYDGARAASEAQRHPTSLAPTAFSPSTNQPNRYYTPNGNRAQELATQWNNTAAQHQAHEFQRNAEFISSYGLDVNRLPVWTGGLVPSAALQNQREAILEQERQAGNGRIGTKWNRQQNRAGAQNGGQNRGQNRGSNGGLNGGSNGGSNGGLNGGSNGGSNGRLNGGPNGGSYQHNNNQSS